MYWAGMEEEAKEGLKKLCERWGTAHPRIVAIERPKPTPFLHFFGIPDRFTGTCIPRTSWSGDEGGEALNQGGEFPWGGSGREGFCIFGAQQLKRMLKRALAAGLCESVGGKPPCRPDTINWALCGKPR